MSIKYHIKMELTVETFLCRTEILSKLSETFIFIHVHLKFDQFSQNKLLNPTIHGNVSIYIKIARSSETLKIPERRFKSWFGRKFGETYK